MQLLVSTVAALIVVLLYIGWRCYHEFQQRRQRVVRERVAYMLWVMTERI